MKTILLISLLFISGYIFGQGSFEADFDTFSHVRNRPLTDYRKESTISTVSNDTIERVLRLLSIETEYKNPSSHVVTQILGDKRLSKDISIIQGRYYKWYNNMVWVVGDEEEKVMVPKMLILGDFVMVLVRKTDGTYMYALSNDLEFFDKP